MRKFRRWSLIVIVLCATSSAHASDHEPLGLRHHLKVNNLINRCARRQQQMQQNQHIFGNNPKVAAQCRKDDKLTSAPKEYQLTQPQ